MVFSCTPCKPHAKNKVITSNMTEDTPRFPIKIVAKRPLMSVASDIYDPFYFSMGRNYTPLQKMSIGNLYFLTLSIFCTLSKSKQWQLVSNQRCQASPLSGLKR